VAELHALLTPAHGHAMITALSAKIHQLQQPASPADLHAALTYVLQELRAKPSLVRDIQAGLLSVTSYLSDGHQAALAQTAAHSQATPAPYPTAPVVSETKSLTVAARIAAPKAAAAAAAANTSQA